MEDAPGWPAGRGMVTIVIAHATFATAYLAVVVQARLVQHDIGLEEAALDLGARPLRVFFAITLPLIWPAVAGGWLLAFTLSDRESTRLNFSPSCVSRMPPTA